MEEINEDDLIMYEESKEIKETIWNVWDIVNDQEIIKKMLLNTSLLKDLKNAQIHSNLLLVTKDNINDNAYSNISEKNGKFIFYINNNISYYFYRNNNNFR